MRELSAYCLLSMMLCYDPSDWTKLMRASLGADRLDPRNRSRASPRTFLSVSWRPALSLSLKCDSSEQLKAAALIVHVSAASPATEWRPGSCRYAAARSSSSCLVSERTKPFMGLPHQRHSHRKPVYPEMQCSQWHSTFFSEALRSVICEGEVCHLGYNRPLQFWMRRDKFPHVCTLLCVCNHLQHLTRQIKLCLIKLPNQTPSLLRWCFAWPNYSGFCLSLSATKARKFRYQVTSRFHSLFMLLEHYQETTPKTKELIVKNHYYYKTTMSSKTSPVKLLLKSLLSQKI